MFKVVTEFKIRILYDSGNSQTFWATKFSVKHDGSISWTAATNNRPLMIASDISKIEAIFQVDKRRRIRWVGNNAKD